jgi:hypothetical protein
MPHQPYAGQGYAGGPYAAPQAYPAPVAMASYPAQAVPNHYGVPHVGAEVAPVQPQPAEAMPSIRRRRVRRRSSPVPALFGAAVVVAGILGGIWFFYKGDETVAVIHSGDSTSQANPSSQLEREGTPVADMRTLGTNGTRTDTQGDMATPANTQGPAGVSDSNDEQSMPVIDPPEPENGMPAMDKPGKDGSEPRPERPTADTPSDKPTRNAKPSEASPEEAAAVTKALKDVRAALAGRDLTKAKDLLDEATIEATAPDTVAQLNRVEMLTSYVEMFWDAARKTLPKLQAAETIEIDGKMVAIVEADEEHLVVRIEGRNREYNWTKIPPRIAYYLADRWLAKDDPVRNLVLAAFEIVEPKGDLAHAERLLDAASAARLNAEPLYAELKAARGG